MKILKLLKKIGKTAFLTSSLLAILGCSSTKNCFKQDSYPIKEKPLETIVDFSIKNISKIDINQSATNCWLYDGIGYKKFYYVNNPVINIGSAEHGEILETLNSIKTDTYKEFVYNLSKLDENQITLVLSSLSRILGDKLYQEGFFYDIDDREIYSSIQNLLNENFVDKKIMCGHIHNFISETARKVGFPEAVTISCNTEEDKHIISAIWGNNKNIKLFDYGNLFFGNSDLESILREYQKSQNIPAFGHSVYKEKLIFSFRTVDGEVFYNAINYPGDTTQLKNILINKNEEDNLKLKLGNTENSFYYYKDCVFHKIGHLRGPGDFNWEAPFFQTGIKKINDGEGLKFYNLSFLVSNIKKHPIFGVYGNLIYEEKIDLSSSDRIHKVGQVAINILSTPFLEINEFFKVCAGVNYVHDFDEQTKTDAYSFFLMEHNFDDVLAQRSMLNLSEIRTGCKLTLNNFYVNPEFVYKDEDDTLSLESGLNLNKLELVLKGSVSKSKYPLIWPDKNSISLLTKYSFLDNSSISGYIEKIEKNWPSDKSEDLVVGIQFGKRF